MSVFYNYSLETLINEHCMHTVHPWAYRSQWKPFQRRARGILHYRESPPPSLLEQEIMSRTTHSPPWLGVLHWTGLPTYNQSLKQGEKYYKEVELRWFLMFYTERKGLWQVMDLWWHYVTVIEHITLRVVLGNLSPSSRSSFTHFMELSLQYTCRQ